MEGRLVVHEPPGHREPGAASPIEPGEAARPVTREDLAPFAHDEEHLDRLLADSHLVERLRASDFSGADWEFVAVKAFAAYGYAVLIGWMRSGLIWRKVHDRCRGLRLEPPPPWATWDHEAWESIATDALAESINSFRDTVLRPGRWDPTRRATLKTFFIGHCLWKFPNAYRRWRTSVNHQDQEQLHDDEGWAHVLRGTDRQVAAQVALAEQLDEERDRLDERTRRVLGLTTDGYDQTEIAAILDTTRKSVEMIVRRHRQRRSERGSA